MKRVARARDDNSRSSARSPLQMRSSDPPCIRGIPGAPRQRFPLRGRSGLERARAPEPPRANLDPVLREEDRSITR
jgi:hypothetical protein